MPGPSTIPTLIAAPISPIAAGRSWGEVLSLAKAIAVGSAADERMPPSVRAANSIHNSVAKPIINCARTLPRMPTRMIGLRP